MIYLKNKNSYLSSITSIGVFLITLQSYYFYNIKLAPFPIIGSLILFLVGINDKISKETLKITFYLFILFLISTLWAFINKLDFIYLNSIIGTLLGLCFFIIFQKYFRNLDKEHVTKIINRVIALHLIFFIIQFSAFYLGGILIDYLYPITGEASRFFFGGALTGLVRCTGLYNEPATYSYYVGGLVFLNILLQKKIDKISIFAIVTIALTLSISGILLSSFIYFYYSFFISKRVKNIFIFIIVSMFIMTIVLLYFNDNVYVYLFERFSNLSDDNSTNIRFFDSFDFLKSKNFLVQLFGVGLGNYTNDVSLTPSGIIGLISSLGFVGYIIFSSILYYYTKKNGVINFIMLNIFLFSTITVQTIFFWFLFSIFYYNVKQICEQ
jgi:hypothetical protein